MSMLSSSPLATAAKKIGSAWSILLTVGMAWIAIGFVVLRFDNSTVYVIAAVFGILLPLLLSAGNEILCAALTAGGWRVWHIKDRLAELTAGNRDLEPFVQDLIDDLAGVSQLCADQEVALDGVIATHENAIASAQAVDSRKIAAIAALLAIPAVISGLYGMNVTNLPGTNWLYGWVVIALVIVLIEVWAYVRFTQRGWL
jgi:uncharacterized membrane protein HdeD (DUF308 family)